MLVNFNLNFSSSPKLLLHSDLKCSTFASSTIARQASTRNSSLKEASFCSTILTTLAFIPHKIWAFVQALFCCNKRPSLLDRIKADPKAVAKELFEQMLHQTGASDLHKECDQLALQNKTEEELNQVIVCLEQMLRLGTQSNNSYIIKELSASIAKLKQNGWTVIQSN